MRMSTETAPSDVLLVGSLPFATAEEAFRTAAQGLRGHIGWLSDGEVGERTNWVGMLPLVVFPKNPDLEETLAPRGGLEQPDRNAVRPPVEDLAGILVLAGQAGSQDSLRRPRLRSLRRRLVRSIPPASRREGDPAGGALPSLAAGAAQRDRRVLRGQQTVA